MKIPRSILSILNVHRDEWWLVQRLFLLQFFQGAGIAFFFTSAFSRFLEIFDISFLSYVFIITSLLLWVSGFIYSKLEHRLPSDKLYIWVTVFIAFSMLFFRFISELINENWYYYLLLAWFYVLYLLNNLMFWGLAAQLYDVRQSKRLFSVISAGDIPAKFVGYSFAGVIVYYIGTLNLLLAGFLFMLLSIPFLLKIIQKEKTEDHQSHDHSSHTSQFHKVVKNYTANVLILRVAFLSLIVYACIILINYAFYAQVKHELKTDVELASFIAIFLAAARLFALLIKIIMTSRLLYWLGNKTSLILTPILLVLLVFVLFITDTFSSGEMTILYVFGFTAILVDVLNSAINSPVLLTIMQPLSTHERLRAHNIVKGIMDPFAYLFCGLFLLAAYRLQLYNLNLLSYTLIFLAAAWIIGVFMVNRQYLKILIHAVSSRFFSEEDFNFYDPSAREMIQKKILNGTDLEVLYILRMLAGSKNEESNKLIILALKHTDEKVIREALKLIRELHLKEAEPDIITIIENEARDNIRCEAIKVLARIQFKREIIQPLLSGENRVIRHAAIISTLNYSPEAELKQEAEQIVGELLASADLNDQSDALDILCETQDHHFDDELIALSTEKESKLKNKAIQALGIHATDKCLEALITHLDEMEKQVLEALYSAKEKALPYLKRKILQNDQETRQNDSLLNTIGRIGSNAAQETLYELLHEKPEIRVKTIKVLHRCHFKAARHQQQFIESIIREQLIDTTAMLYMQLAIQHKMDHYAVLFTSLQLELLTMRESLLNLFSFLYDREKINKVKLAIEINKKETNANAIELVDMTVKKEFANPFNAAFEFGDLEHRTALLKNLLPKAVYSTIEDVIKEILAENKPIYNNWSKASSLYVSKKYEHKLVQKLANQYLESPDILLKETAEYAAGIY